MMSPEHGALVLQDATLRSALDLRVARPDPCPDYIRLLHEVLASPSTEVQTSRVKKIGAMAAKLAPSTDAHELEDRSLWLRIVANLLLRPAPNTSHFFVPLARVLDEVHEAETASTIALQWATDAPLSSVTWLQFGALLGAHQHLMRVAVDLRERFFQLASRRLLELADCLGGQGWLRVEWFAPSVAECTTFRRSSGPRRRQGSGCFTRSGARLCAPSQSAGALPSRAEHPAVARLRARGSFVSLDAVPLRRRWYGACGAA